MRLILLTVLTFVFSTAVHAQNWAPLGTGTNNEVRSMVTYSNQLVAAGRFTIAGGNIVSRIARWNGSSWTGFGIDFNDDVFALAIYNNELIAAGQFTTAGGVSANRIAKWNGTTWTPLGSGLNGDVYALAVFNNKIIAGGIFTTAGGVTANRIAQWDGTNWTPLGSGMNDDVNALQVQGTNLFAGGEFTTSGGVTTRRIARWDGTNWWAMGVGLDNGEVHALTIYNNNLAVGGTFTHISNVNVNRIALWNGSNWQLIGSGVNNRIRTLHTVGSILYAGGIFTNAGGTPTNYTAMWNGTAWSAMGAGIVNGTEVFAMAYYGGAINVGGSFTNAGNVNVGNVAKFGSVPNAPNLISPANNSTGQPLNVTLDWSDAANATQYRVQVSLSNTFSTTVVNATPTASTYQIPNGVLQLNTPYYWRAAGINSFGTGSYSTVWMFNSVVTGIGTNSNVPQDFALYQNYPNPFNPVTTIKYDVPEKSNVKLSLYNTEGKLAAELFSGEMEAGSYTITLNASSLTSGIYYYRMQAGDRSFVKKLTIVK